MNENLVRFDAISKRFGGVIALSNISFSVRKGSIHAVIGENGAGKSTLFSILCGKIPLYEGTVYFDDKPINFKEPLDAIKCGISTVYQELSLCNNLSMEDNIFLGKEKYFPIERRKKIITERMQALKVDLPFGVPVKFFTIAQKQLIEIIKATISENKLLILDEPTSSLNNHEADCLLDLLVKLKQDGVTILLVSHRLEEIMKVADYITVLRDGKYIDTIIPGDATQQQIIKMMVGREIIHVKREIRDFSQTPVTLHVSNLTIEPFFRNCNIELHEGEILGIAGLEGCGRYEFVRAIFGLLGKASGKISVNGQPYVIHDPDHAIKCGLGFIARERKEEGILPLMNLVDNITIIMDRKKFWFNDIQSRRNATEYANNIGLKYSKITQLITSLSGGNQQKCILARLVANDPEIYIMEEPTRGIDVGSKQEVFRIVKDLSIQKKSILIISSELAELMNECDRIVVMYNGTIVGEVIGATTTQEEIISLAMGYQN